MTLWRLVEDAPPDAIVFGIITCHPRRLPDDFDPANPCRYFIESTAFRAQFGQVTEVSAFDAVRSYASWARGGPLGEGEVVFSSRSGERHRFHLVTFYNRFEALTLGVHLGLVGASILVP